VSLAASVGWLATLVLALAWWHGQRRVAVRSEAVTRACHELRGPLTAARLGLDLGTRGQQLSPAQIRAIGSELGRASLALDDLTRAGERPTQLTAGERSGELIEVGLVDLCALLADSVAAWQPSAVAAGVELVLNEPAAAVLVRGQRLRLAQAVGNLIANAIEHGGRRVSVEIAVAGCRAQIAVRDDGPGLPDSVPALTHRARRGRGARGRGLAIVQGIAAVHGGRLRACQAERGAHLALELPVVGGGATG
jgi:signal transduction histidine kinase